MLGEKLKKWYIWRWNIINASESDCFQDGANHIKQVLGTEAADNSTAVERM